jgi:hypothetical protein
LVLGHLDHVVPVDLLGRVHDLGAADVADNHSFILSRCCRLQRESSLRGWRSRLRWRCRYIR